MTPFRYMALGALSDLGLLLAGFFLPFPLGPHGPGGAGFVLNVVNWPLARLLVRVYPSFWAASDEQAIALSVAVVVLNGAIYGLVYCAATAWIQGRRANPVDRTQHTD